MMDMVMEVFLTIFNLTGTLMQWLHCSIDVTVSIRCQRSVRAGISNMFTEYLAH